MTLPGVFNIIVLEKQKNRLNRARIIEKREKIVQNEAILVNSGTSFSL